MHAQYRSICTRACAVRELCSELTRARLVTTYLGKGGLVKTAKSVVRRR